jgi:hypothetical protein
MIWLKIAELVLNNNHSLTHSSIREATPMKKVFKKNHIILESNQDAPMVYCSTYLILKIRISL